MTSDGNRVTIDGADILRRRKELGVSTIGLARAAGFRSPRVVQKAVKNDASDDTMTKLWQTLDGIEAGTIPHPGSDPRERVVEAVLEGIGPADRVDLEVFADGTRALYVIPPGGHRPRASDMEDVEAGLDE